MNATLQRLELTRVQFGDFRHWIVEKALPLWLNSGWNEKRQLFHERLTLDGFPIVQCDTRLMVQARQVYAFSQAHLLGWIDARSKISSAMNSMLEKFKSPDGKPGYVHSLAPDGSVANDNRDTYAHAFVLLALAWYYRLTADENAIAEADNLLVFMDEYMASARGGYEESYPVVEPVRGQNVHMHFIEAMIALYTATGQVRFLARAGEIFGLFSSRFFDADSGSLIEFFNEKFEAQSGDRGLIREPGHQYEWVWLLSNFNRLSGRKVAGFTTALYDHADRFGWDTDGFVVDQIYSHGAVAFPWRRCWPHTECIKASVKVALEGNDKADARAAAAIKVLMGSFFSGCVPGGWRDHFDDNGKLTTEFMPASSLYHILCAAVEVESALNGTR